MKMMHSVGLKGLWISSTQSSWSSVTKGTSQVSTQEPTLFNLLISNLQGGTEHTFSKYTDNAKLKKVVDTAKGCIDLIRLKKTVIL